MDKPLVYSHSGEQFTAHFESCRLTSYRDARGIWTIGYGHTHGVQADMNISEADADSLLREDLQYAVNCVNASVKLQLTQDEFDAVVDFVFNIGCGAFQRSSLLAFLNVGKLEAAASEFERWSFAGGKRVAGLVRRRAAEARLFKGDAEC